MGKNRRIAKQRKAEGSRPLLTQQEHMGTDYRAYAFSWKERLRMAAVYAACSGSFAYLFYRSRAVFLLLWIFYFIGNSDFLWHKEKRIFIEHTLERYVF